MCWEWKMVIIANLVRDRQTQIVDRLYKKLKNKFQVKIIFFCNWIVLNLKQREFFFHFSLIMICLFFIGCKQNIKKAKARVFVCCVSVVGKAIKIIFPIFPLSSVCVFLACFLNRKHGKLFKEFSKLAYSGELLLSV